MTLSYLAFCLAAGILWADTGHWRLPEAWMLVATFGTCLGWALAIVRARRAGPRSGRSGKGPNRVLLLRFVSFGVAGWLAFDAGFTALDQRIQHAERDAVRANINAQEGPRIAEAVVKSRRATAWGEEIELCRVRAADAGSALPQRLILRIALSDGPTGASELRALNELWPGAAIRLGLRVVPFHSPRNPGAIDYERVAARRGIGARARLVDPRWLVLLEGRRANGSEGPDRIPDAPARAAWRTARRNEIGIGLVGAGDRSGLARALALGDRTGLGPELAEDFRRLGLSHLLAVSGLHVGMVAGLVAWLVMRSLSIVGPSLVNPFPWGIASAIGAAGVYAWLVGQSVSVERAWGCLFVAGALMLARRVPRPIELLAGIAIVFWLSEPASLFALGAELSFAACGGLVAAGVWRGALHEEGNERGAQALRSSTIARVGYAMGLGLRASLAAGFGTSVILALHDLSPALFGPLANALAVPWTALVVLPGSLLASIGTMLQSSPVLGAMPVDARGFGWVGLLLWPGERMVEAVSWSADRLPQIPTMDAGSYVVGLIVAGCGLLALRARWRCTVALCWIAVSLVAPVKSAVHVEMERRPRVWFFDVGQGDAALVEGRHASVLVDAGPGPADGSGGRALVRSLRALGRTSLDVLVVSHADLDHRGGAIRVLEELDVGELWVPEAGRDDPTLQRLARIARAAGTQVAWRSADGERVSRGDLRIETLWPPASGPPRSRNEGSLVLRVVVEGRSFLFLADVDKAIEAALVRAMPGTIRSDYLKVSHHGSGGGTSARFLQRVAARHAIVSAPCRASRGLPSPRTMDRIRASTSRLWWTGRDGAVVVFPGDAREPGEVRGWAPPRRCPTGPGSISD